MIRGTTPTLQFDLPVDLSLVNTMTIALSQDGAVVLVKTINDCQVDGNRVTCRLAQKDTLALTHNRPVELQVRIKTTGGDAMASQIVTKPVERILQEGEI